MRLKLYLVNDQPYLTSDEKFNIGDELIVTVGEKYPTVVQCQSEAIYNLLMDHKLTLTKPNKVILNPKQISYTTQELLDMADENGMVEIQN
jgi:hypothetical protein